jgi:antitoxin ParD1/3/4
MIKGMNDLNTLQLPNINNFVIMGKNTSISIGSHFEQFIAQILDSGDFNNKSEVVRAGLRLLEEQEAKKQLLRKALIEGEESGIVTDFDPEQFLKNLHTKHNV